MKVKSEREVTQLCPTLSMDCSLPGFSIHGVFQASILEWGAIAFSDMCVNSLQIYAVIFLLLKAIFPLSVPYIC